MEGKYYSSERNIQILISLLKQHNIKYVIASPGTTNMTLVASMMQDKWFKMFSSADERSASYLACGMAAEAGEPVVLTCTGATASRNYLPGLTEAYYRKLPVLAVTGTQDVSLVGHMIPQVIDRSSLPKDIALLSEQISTINTPTDEWSNTIKINRAILELKHRGGGPVHVNLTTTYSNDFSVSELPESRVIRRTCWGEEMPELPQGRIAVFVGNHVKFSASQVKAIDNFCAKNNSVVFVDQTSGYNGKYSVLFSIVKAQLTYSTDLANVDLLIHVGEVTGDYPSLGIGGKKVWRVSEDGELRDPHRALSHVFEMSEQRFFEYYGENGGTHTEYLEECLDELERVRSKINPDDLPFSNPWIAMQTAHHLPENSSLHLAILNSLRSWNLFAKPSTVYGYSNTGGFGIDGDVSTMIGASLINPNKFFFGVFGDLAFFYDMNVIGNRHLGKNIRILLINNGKGTEFRNFNHPGSAFGEEADLFIAGGGHYGHKSYKLIRHYAEDLGFEYMSASNKEEYLQSLGRFVTPEITEKPMLYEVFTLAEDESNGIKILFNLVSDTKSVAKEVVKSIFGNKGIEVAKKLIGK